MRRVRSFVCTVASLACVVLLAASCAKSIQPLSASSSMASPTTAGPGAPSGAPFRVVGASGGYAWEATSTRLYVTTDGGQHWSARMLPAHWSAGSGILVGPSGEVILSTQDGNAASLYRAASVTNSWSKSDIALAWPSNAPAAPPGQLNFSIGSSSSTGTITAVVTEGGAKSGPVSLVLLSTDGGATFQQRGAPTLFGDWQAAFTSGTTGVIEGTANNQPSGALYYTTNGGTSWAPAVLPGYQSTSASTATLGAPQIDGSRIYVTADIPTTGSLREHALYASDDGGRTFMLEDETTTPESSDLTPPEIGIDGSSVWVIPDRGGSVSESSNGGATWSEVSASGLGGIVGNVGLSDGDSAAAWISPPSCRTSKTTCLPPALFTTADGGRTWKAAPLPAAA